MTRPQVPLGDELLEAALAYAARGWPVFPCNPKNKQPLLAADKDESGAAIRGSGGVKKASTDPERIRGWWKKWPKALVAIATGHPTRDLDDRPLFVLDFDPRTDAATGEVFTLERLKDETETQVGASIPPSLTALTPSDGVHVYLLGDDGPAPTNRGNLPLHVDVRGIGGYVIAPPSVMGPNAIKGQAGLRYRWHRKEPVGGIAPAPAGLLAELRAPKRKPPKDDAAADQAASASPPSRPGDPGDDPEEAAVRRYALAALDEECRLLARTPLGNRDNQANASGFVIGQLVGAGALGKAFARSALQAAVQGFNDPDGRMKAVDNGLDAGESEPRDLSAVRAAARDRALRQSSGQAARGPPRRDSSCPAPPLDVDRGRPSSQTGDRALERAAVGGGGGATGAYKPGPTRRCAFRPLTDLGNLERFLERFGGDFLYVEAWGWLAWDGRRWNRDLALPMLGHAVQRTMRAIQAEADLIRESGVPEEPLEMWDDAKKAEHEAAQRGRLDRVLEKKRGKTVLLSDAIAKWGRTSEGAGHINCIPKLAEARLSARTEDFDADPLKLNVENGTIVYSRPEADMPASWAIREHRREDRLTKLARVVHDEQAACPRFDAFLAQVQPSPDMQAFLDCWGGYSSLGLADAQKMALFYGEGSNGKGVWITVLASILGDYAWKTGVETFIDQGRYRKGSDATPDLAALAGRRMVYANEPEENSKFSDGLVKAMTSDEPLGGIRELNKPPFELLVTFNNTVLANNMPRIGTDHGIQRRMQVVPWDVIIPDEAQDLQLKAKLMEEASGIFNRFVQGALAYLDGGLPVPEAVREATREYQEDNDLLGEFLRLAVARVPGMTVGATAFHRAFAAWQTWANKLPQSGKPWSPKYLYQQMKKKRFKDHKSSVKQWHDVALRYEELDFVTVDEAGRMRPVEAELPAPKRYEGELGADGRPLDEAAPAAAPPADDDDFIGGWDPP